MYGSHYQTRENDHDGDHISLAIRGSLVFAVHRFPFCWWAPLFLGPFTFEDPENGEFTVCG